MQTALIILSAFATILTGYVDSINEAREIWLKNRIPNEVANKYKDIRFSGYVIKKIKK